MDTKFHNQSILNAINSLRDTQVDSTKSDAIEAARRVNLLGK